jgi:polyisoprenyl-phosphate glycosyltransferase
VREPPAAVFVNLAQSMVELSVVVPVYRCETCLRPLYERLRKSVGEVTDSWELIFIDDRSPDSAWSTLVELAGRDPRVRAVRLSRNFGQHAAITAGLAKSTGRWTAVLDCDLQDPPEQIPRFYAKAQEGFDVVMSRRSRRRQSGLRRIGGYLYTRLRNALLSIDVDTNLSTLSVLSRDVVDAFLKVGDRDRHFVLILHWLGFERITLEIPHAERESGESSYTLRGLLRMGLDGMFFQTTKLLRWIVYAGLGVAMMSFLLAVAIVLFYIVANPLPGWTSLVLLILGLAGILLISMGVTSLYIGRIFEQVKDRPLYVVDAELSGGSGAAGSLAENGERLQPSYSRPEEGQAP